MLYREHYQAYFEHIFDFLSLETKAKPPARSFDIILSCAWSKKNYINKEFYLIKFMFVVLFKNSARYICKLNTLMGIIVIIIG